MADYVKRFCNTFLIEGIFLFILGALVILLPQISTLAMSLIISMGLILAGIYKFISSIIRRDEIEKSWLSVFIALLMIGIGVWLTLRPLFNLFLLTMGAAVYFILEGINSMVIAFETKGVLKHWWVGLITGLAQFALAFVIIFGMPGTAFWTIGLLIGINLLLSGVALISVYTGAGCQKMKEA